MTGPSRRRRTARQPIALRDVIESPVRNQSGANPPAADGGADGPASSAPPKRRRRAKVGGFALKLGAPLRDGETRRWVNDDGNRIAELRELGYEHVSETGIQTADPGSRVKRLVGTKANGEPLHAYLMETPDELYTQGVDEKEAANRLIDEAITAGRDSTGRMDEHQYGQGSIKVER